MKEESDTPFSFNPGDNIDQQKEGGSSSFFANNKKLIIILAVGIVLVIAIAVVLILVLTKSKSDKSIPAPNTPYPCEKTNNYFTARYEVPKANMEVKLFNQYAQNPLNLNYSNYVTCVEINNTSMNLTDGKFKFTKEGNYTANIYLKENLNILDSFFYSCLNLVEIDFSHLFVKQITTMRKLFLGCTKFKTINYGNDFNTNNLNNISELFCSCNSLEEIDFSHFDISNVEDMSSTFQGCSKLKKISFSNNINTKKVKYMRYLFSGCKSLSSLDLSGFDTSNVQNFEYMFQESSAITTLMLDNFNTENALDVSNMFEGCSGLVLLDLSKFSTANVVDMSSMFNGCTKLQSLTLKFKTNEVLYMDKMFQNCQSLRSLDLSSFTNPKLTRMNEMFSGCQMLSSLDMSSFNSKLVVEMTETFYELPAEGTITYDSSIFTENLLSLIPSGWTRADKSNQTLFE